MQDDHLRVPPGVARVEAAAPVPLKWEELVPDPEHPRAGHREDSGQMHVTCPERGPNQAQHV